MVEPSRAQHSSYLDGRDIAVEANGRFEIVLAPKKPEGFTGTWHPIREDVDCFMVRMRSYDWGNEIDTRMGIAPHTELRMSVAEIDEKLRGALTLSQRLNPLFYGFQNKTLERAGTNAFEIEPFADTGLAKKLYWTCVFAIEEDEALIIDTDLPDVRPY